ncbi:MAG TPA: endonuclease MutS2 [Proteobacteria bacterium]|nr:endonuclease MutS2 [bacterium BMS3Abin14]HDL52755.1 endonuclease MutS2 [Pseudomonadota bacterium]
MNDHALKVLEYNDLLSCLAGCAHSEPGSHLALRLLPCPDRQSVVADLALTQEALHLLEIEDVNLSEVQNTTAVLDRLRAEGSVLGSDDLMILLSNQKSVGTVRRTLREFAGALPGLSSLVQGMASFPEWERWVGRSFTESGEMMDNAGPELARVRRELRSARDTVLDRLEKFRTQDSAAKVIRDDYVTIRNGRYVLPVKPEYHRAFKGIVQSRSQSGQTLFVEPLFAVDLNNRLTGARVQEEKEIHRILARMSADAREVRESMASNLELLARLDLVLAKGRLGRKLDGIIPQPADETELVDARHPLLVLSPETECVPVSLGIGGASTALVITGPNTGGKTITLKTVGLLTLMAQSGIPIPAAEGTRMRVFSRVFADIGDEQSLSQNLSTFSAHMKVVSRILSHADHDTLVLLDELGAGTDPQEGSALGVALLEALGKKGTCVVVTTHHNLLKEFAYRAAYAKNASTVFDPESLKPTFRIKVGLPGRSHALKIAGQLGVDRNIIARAQEIMGTGAVRADELLGRLSEEVDREARARASAERISARLEADRDRLRIRRKAAQEKAEKIQEEARREASDFIRDLTRRGKDILKGLKDDPGSGRKGFPEKIREMRSEVMERLPPPAAVAPSGKPVSVGGRVEVMPLGIKATVTALLPGGKEAEVLSGEIRMRAPLRRLFMLEDGEGQSSSGIDQPPPVGYEGEGGLPVELNLLGFTVEDALESVDKVLDRSLMEPGYQLRIVHGKGSGALRKAITASLRDDPRVLKFGVAPREAGGAGVTVVELKT